MKYFVLKFAISGNGGGGSEMLQTIPYDDRYFMMSQILEFLRYVSCGIAASFVIVNDCDSFL